MANKKGDSIPSLPRFEEEVSSYSSTSSTLQENETKEVPKKTYFRSALNSETSNKQNVSNSSMVTRKKKIKFRRLDKEMDKILYNLLHERREGQHFRSISHQDDNVATGSSYQYVDWSKPSKDGWMAVQNPHLRMFSQIDRNFKLTPPFLNEAGLLSRDFEKELLTKKVTVRKMPYLPPTTNSFASDSYDHQLKKFTKDDYVNGRSDFYQLLKSRNEFLDDRHDERDFMTHSMNQEDPCSAAPRCYHETKRTDFAGCFEDESYPYHDMYVALLRDPLIDQKLAAEPFLSSMMAEPMNDAMNTVRLDEKDRVSNNDDTWADHAGPLCSSRVEYARPRRLLNVEMQWRVIVNDGQKLQQTVRLETCLKAQKPCRLLAPCYSSICVQKYAFHRLLSYDPCAAEKGLFIDVYRLPIACSCATYQF